MTTSQTTATAPRFSKEVRPSGAEHVYVPLGRDTAVTLLPPGGLYSDKSRWTVMVSYWGDLKSTRFFASEVEARAAANAAVKVALGWIGR